MHWKVFSPCLHFLAASAVCRLKKQTLSFQTSQRYGLNAACNVVHASLHVLFCLQLKRNSIHGNVYLVVQTCLQNV